MSRVVSLIIFCLFLGIVPCQGLAQVANPYSSGGDLSLPVMRPDAETRGKWEEEFRRMPEARLDKDVAAGLALAEAEGRATSKSVLDYLSYVPAERNQGAQCGNCWVWTGTGIVEIALNVEKGIKDRHSIQLFNSCRTGAYACCGDTLSNFADWYGGNGFTIPWTNTNASFADAARTCVNGASTVACGSIAKEPSYPINTITAVIIPTHGVGQARAIANIKNILNQNKAVYFHYELATGADWAAFRNFWTTRGEGDLWNPNPYCGHAYNNGGGAHAMLLTGYNDNDPNPANHYWVVLNSWGTTAGRPNGLFRMPMALNYDCTVTRGGSLLYASWFQTLDVNFDRRVELPRTGQTKCYSAAGDVISCAGTGQDGDVRAGVPWPDPRFVDNKDGTMTDYLTGLMWTKDGCTPGPDVCQYNGPGAKTWPQGLQYVACLNTRKYLGYTDWRMPNILELESLYNDGTTDTDSWLYSQGFSCVTDAPASSTTAGEGNYIWEFSFGIGEPMVSVWPGNRMIWQVWPVRSTGMGQARPWRTGKTRCFDPVSGAQIDCAGTGQDGELKKGVAWPDPRFTDLGTGVVMDNLTGLWWAKSGDNPGPDACHPGTFVPWIQSFDYIKCLNRNRYLGYSDWRMPNRKEFMTFRDWGSPTAVPAYFPFSFTPNGCYVASDSNPQNPWTSWTMWGFLPDIWQKSYLGHAWPVRAGSIYKALNVKKAGVGAGTVESAPEGIYCGKVCSRGFGKNTAILLTAASDPGSAFLGWSGSGTGCSGTGPCSLTITDDVTVTANFGIACVYAVSPKAIAFPIAGGSATVTITAKGKSCAAPEVTADSWITVGPVVWSNNKTAVKVSAKANTLSKANQGSIYAAGQTISATQAAKPCTVTAFTPPNAAFDNAFRTGEFTVTATPSDCVWIAVREPNSPWVTIKSGTGAGGSKVAYTVDANKTGRARTGKIDVVLTSNKKVKVFQISQRK